MLYSNIPRSVDEAVAALLSQMSLRDKVNLANIGKTNLYQIDISWGSYIRQEFGLLTGNRDLINSCRVASGVVDLSPDKGSLVIITALWQLLRKTYRIRVVK